MILARQFPGLKPFGGQEFLNTQAQFDAVVSYTIHEEAETKSKGTITIPAIQED